MKKSVKLILGCGGAVFALLAAAVIVFVLWWSGDLNGLFVKEVAVFESPGGSCSLVFQQLGEPDWPFGQTDVRLTLKDENNRTLNRVDTAIQDDGGNASAGNVKSVEWTDDCVIVILQASEMTDEEVIITYKK